MPDGGDPLRITKVAFRYPPSTRGGAGLYTHMLGRGLAARGHRVRVVAATDTGSGTGSYTIDGIDVQVMKVSSEPPWNKFTFVRNPGTLRKDFGEGDIAHVHNIGAFSSTLFKALRDQGGHRGTVWTAHDVQLVSLRVPEARFDDLMAGRGADIPSIGEEAGRGDLKSRMVWRHMLPNIDRYVAISGFMHNMLQAAGVERDRCRLVYNGIDLGANPASEVPEGPTVLFVGGVVRIKGVDHLLEAMPLVLEHVPEARLRIVGEGDMADPLGARAKALGIADRVSFEGAKEDVRPYYRDAQVVVQPSVVHETFSLVVLEGMAAGRPVVAANRGSLPELVEEGRTGLLFKPGDVEDLAEKLVSVLGSRDRSVSFGRAGRERAEQMFSMDRAVDGTLGVYRELLEA